jgi:hypothetical protein
MGDGKWEWETADSFLGDTRHAQVQRPLLLGSERDPVCDRREPGQRLMVAGIGAA